VRGHAYITFLSDYGWMGGYVAACEAVIASICPQARVLHITHEIGLEDVSEGAAVLARVAALGPVAVHLAVVDPGVGTDRAAIVVRATRGDYLVGPDNGLLIPAAETLGGVEEAWALDAGIVRSRAALEPVEPSPTFHGRDVFAPAAALLVDGIQPALLGRTLDPTELLRPKARLVEFGPDSARVEVSEVDRFGNVALAVGLEHFCFETPCDLTVKAEKSSGQEWRCRIVRTFSDLRPGELGILQDSWGHASLTLNGASAAELLGVGRGGIVTIWKPSTDEAGGPVGEAACSPGPERR
jgi:S-adenosylmethionine hydrolase